MTFACKLHLRLLSKAISKLLFLSNLGLSYGMETSKDWLCEANDPALHYSIFSIFTADTLYSGILATGSRASLVKKFAADSAK